MYVCIYMYICIYIYVYIYIYICIQEVRMYACVCICKYVIFYTHCATELIQRHRRSRTVAKPCMYVCVYVCIYIYIYEYNLYLCIMYVCVCVSKYVIFYAHCATELIQRHRCSRTVAKALYVCNVCMYMYAFKRYVCMCILCMCVFAYSNM